MAHRCKTSCSRGDGLCGCAAASPHRPPPLLLDLSVPAQQSKTKNPASPTPPAHTKDTSHMLRCCCCLLVTLALPIKSQSFFFGTQKQNKKIETTKSQACTLATLAPWHVPLLLVAAYWENMGRCSCMQSPTSSW